MNFKVLYQTLENRENPDEVENNGPYPCRKNPWLGNGYYFWDTFIELAHWWGKVGYKDNYFICKCLCNDNNEEILDLVGNTSHIKYFRKCTLSLKKAYPNETITVPFVVENIRKMKSFGYKAIRSYPIGSSNGDKYLRKQRIYFVDKNTAYLDMMPSIQICVLDKSFIYKGSYKIQYPEEYSEGYTI